MGDNCALRCQNLPEASQFRLSTPGSAPIPFLVRRNQARAVWHSSEHLCDGASFSCCKCGCGTLVKLLPVGSLRVKLIWAVRGATGITKVPRKSLPSLGALRSPIAETPGKWGVNKVLVTIKKLFDFLLRGMLLVLPVLSQLSWILSSNEWPVCPCEHVQLSVGLCSITGITSHYQGCSLWQKGCGDPLRGAEPQSPIEGCCTPYRVWHKVRAWAFCENRNSGAEEIGLGSSFQSRNRPYYLLLNLVLTAELSPR